MHVGTSKLGVDASTCSPPPAASQVFPYSRPGDGTETGGLSPTHVSSWVSRPNQHVLNSFTPFAYPRFSIPTNAVVFLDPYHSFYSVWPRKPIAQAF